MCFQSKIVRVLNLWQKNAVFKSDIIQPLLDMAAGIPPPSVTPVIPSSAAPVNNTTPGQSKRCSSAAKARRLQTFSRVGQLDNPSFCVSRHPSHSGDASQHSSGSARLGVTDHQHGHYGRGGADPAESSGSTGESPSLQARLELGPAVSHRPELSHCTLGKHLSSLFGRERQM